MKEGWAEDDGLTSGNYEEEAVSTVDPMSAVAAGYATVPEACRFHGVTRQAVYRAIEEGRVPAVRVGNAWMIARSAMRAYSPLPPIPGSGRKKRRVDNG